MLPSISLLLKIDERERNLLVLLMVGMCSRKEHERHYRFCGDARRRSEKRQRRNVAAVGNSVKTSELK